MHTLAASKGGKCLSKEYGGNKMPLEWECSIGHRWETSADNIVKGSWCHECAQGVSERICRKLFETIFSKKFPLTKRFNWLVNSRGNRMELDGYCKDLKLAFEYHGVQHYKKSRVRSMDLKQRKEDDERKLELCEQHDIILVEIPYTVEYENMAEYIIKQCKFLGVAVPELDEMPDYKLLNAYSPEALKELQETAASKGGECLSKQYINKNTKMQWRCKEGHVWWACADSVRQGKWCAVCGIKRRADKSRSNIDAMHKLAESRGGECLSTVYINSTIRLEWRCKEGHTWWVVPGNIKNSNTWCPYCSNRRPYRIILTLEDMHKTAASNGGECLSTEYKNNRVKLKWKCKKGHVWDATSGNIRAGTWCPICSRKKQIRLRKHKTDEAQSTLKTF